MDAKLLFTYALTPLHAGTGRGVGVIDLPIAREVATGIPYLPGSSLKGVLRDKSADEAKTTTIFGPSTDNINESNLSAGSAQFTDQRLLLLPVRSLKGTFAWVTCPFILHRLRRECVAIGKTQELPEVPEQPVKETVLIPTGQQTLTTSNKIVLEDLDLTPNDAVSVLAWATWLGQKLFPHENEWQTLLREKLVVVHDDIFSYLLQTATEVVARIRIDDDSKTVVKGGLWYEENLPAESVLWGLVAAQQVGKENMSPQAVLTEVQKLTEGVVQLGGNATVGRGLSRLVMV